MITRPLLAQELEDFKDIKFPVYVSAKLDGIRCLKVGGKVLSRSFKPIPNRFIREYLEANALDGMDGELITYTNNVPDEYNVIQSKVMTEEVDPGTYIFWVFDYAPNINKPYRDRMIDLGRLPKIKNIFMLDYGSVDSIGELERYEDIMVENGYEGIMLRAPEGRYKCGRSTVKEGILLKFKRFMDSEAEVLEIREKETNIGKKEVNELGLTKRSHKKADRKLAGTMGEFWVKDLVTGKEFSIGTGIGLTKELRQELWDNKDKYIGKTIKYKYQKCGQKDLPRFPSFLGFRHRDDMS